MGLSTGFDRGSDDRQSSRGVGRGRRRIVVDPTTVELTVCDARDRAVDAAALELVPGALSIRSSLPSLDDGIYVVSWQAFSDLNGHGVARRPVVPLGLLVASAAFWSAPSVQR